MNPDPRRFDGVLLPFQVRDLKGVMAEVLKDRRQCKKVTMAKVTLNDGRTLYAVNDFFVGPKTHVSARYVIRHGQREETHSSSGVIVSTGLGSTGWLKSLLTGADAISAALHGGPQAAGKAGEAKPPLPPMGWDADYLYFTVREPFPSRTTAATVVFGAVTAREGLRLSSLMAENGVISATGSRRISWSSTPGRRRRSRWRNGRGGWWCEIDRFEAAGEFDEFRHASEFLLVREAGEGLAHLVGHEPGNFR